MNAEYYHIVVIDGCPFCDNARALAQDSEVPHYIEDSTENAEYLTEMKKVLDHHTVPIVRKVTIRGGEIKVDLIGGFTEFKEHLNIEES